MFLLIIRPEGVSRVQKLRENLYDTNELKFLRSFDIMWEQGRVLTLYPLNSLGSVVSISTQQARPRQMIPGRCVKDTRAQAASAAVQGGSWIVVLTPEYWELWSIEYSVHIQHEQRHKSQHRHGNMEHLTSHPSDSGVWAYHGHRVRTQESQPWCHCHLLLRTNISYPIIHL